MSHHAKLRTMQRIPGVCPGLLIRGVQWAIKNNRRDILQFVDWSTDRRCIWWGMAATGQPFTAVANPVNGRVITIIDGWKYGAKRRSAA